MHRSSSAVRLTSFAAIFAIAVAACAATGTHSPGATGSGSPGGSSGGITGDDTGEPVGTFVSEAGAPDDGKAPRAQRCDDAGRCTCFNIASIGQPGHTGFQSGMDSTTAFTDWLNTQSS